MFLIFAETENRRNGGGRLAGGCRFRGLEFHTDTGGIFVIPNFSIFKLAQIIEAVAQIQSYVGCDFKADTAQCADAYFGFL
ncbi:hypothetical protein NEIPOLOT_00342 [Neisseria polysaccharea ATCC 43768]|nr:hypothetical protein NEIPOLOT_00342 [Neisseria polysaccharea ATCC 43768]